MMGSCASWLLLVSHAVLLGIGCFGSWLAVTNFANDGPPLPAAASFNTTTPTPSSHNTNRHQIRSFSQTDYDLQTRRYAILFFYPWFYVMVSCGAAVVVATPMLLMGLCSRKFFTTTSSLYSSLGLLILTLVMLMVYQILLFGFEDGTKFLPSAGLVVGIQAGVLLLLTLQMVLAIWELRGQKARWPTIKLTQFFTLNFILLLARLILAVLSTTMFDESEIILGLRKITRGVAYEPYMSSSPVDRYPLWLGLSGAVGGAYILVALSEAILSAFFGSVHAPLACITTLMSAVCSGWLAVLVSPLFITAVAGIYEPSYCLMTTSIIMSVVTFIQAIAWLFAPSALQAPPKCIKVVADKLSSLSLSGIAKIEYTTEGYSTLPDYFQREISKMKMSYDPSTKGKISLFISTGASLVLIIVVSCQYSSFAQGLLLGVNLSILCRSFPPLVAHIYGAHTPEVVPFAQIVLRLVMEWVLSLLAAITGASAVGFTFIFLVIETLMLLGVYNDCKHGRATSDITKLLGSESTAEETAKPLQDFHPVLLTGVMK